MAPRETTTLRVTSGLRDDIARIAEQRGTTMVEVVHEAIARMDRDLWWEAVHQSLDHMTSSEVAAYRKETQQFDAAAGDGLHGG